MIDEKSISISPSRIKRPETIACLNLVDYESKELTGEVINFPYETDPPSKDQCVGFWRLNSIKEPKKANELIIFKK